MKYDPWLSRQRHVASGHERLAYLAAFLDTVAPDRVTFSRWYSSGKGCAVGLAAVLEPRIQAQGLGLANEDSLKECRPVYAGKSDWEAVTAFFGITHQQATVLFTPAGYHGELRPHPRRISDRIRSMLAEPTPVPVGGIVRELIPA